MSELERKLESCFQAVFAGLSSAAVRQASPENTPGWDSTALVTLMSVVEEEFGLCVPPEDLEHWDCFTAVADYLRAHK